MSIYVNRVFGCVEKDGKKLGGVEVALYSQSEEKIIDTTHTHRGYWKFVNISPGFYNIYFYGRGTTEKDDWLFGLEVVDAAAAADAVPPTSSVVDSASLEA